MHSGRFRNYNIMLFEVFSRSFFPTFLLFPWDLYLCVIALGNQTLFFIWRFSSSTVFEIICIHTNAIAYQVKTWLSYYWVCLRCWWAKYYGGCGVWIFILKKKVKQDLSFCSLPSLRFCVYVALYITYLSVLTYKIKFIIVIFHRVV